MISGLFPQNAISSELARNVPLPMAGLLKRSAKSATHIKVQEN
jgi:hypothetical protein